MIGGIRKGRVYRRMKVRTKIFEYGLKEMEYLKKADQALGAAIDRIGKVERIIIPDLFPALIHVIIGQQISLKAARTIWARLQEHFDDVIPEVVAGASVEEIQRLGMPTKKAGYIKNLAKIIAKGDFSLDRLYQLPDDEVIRELSSLSGIGVWTAEMLLLNSMERPDIVSFGDIAIRRGMMMLYGLDSLSRKQFDLFRSGYSPYGSVASIYLWRVSYGE